jgi:hypothetical protein
MVESDHVPSLPKKPHTQRLQYQGKFLILPRIVVGDMYLSILLHRINDGLQILLARGHILQQNAVSDTLAAHQRIAYRKRAIEPRAESFLGEILVIIDVVTIVAAAFILNVDSKQDLNGIKPSFQRPFGEIFTTAKISVIFPSLVKFIIRDPLGPIDSLYQPHILAHQVGSSVFLFFRHIIRDLKVIATKLQQTSAILRPRLAFSSSQNKKLNFSPSA